MIGYFAAAWSRREEMRELAALLERLIPGFTVNSRWIKEEPCFGLRGKKLNAFKQRRAMEDREDVYAADVLIRFADDLSAEMVPSKLATGARMTEMGFALGNAIPVIVVGGKQCIFDWLPEVQHVKNVVSLKRVLRRIKSVESKYRR